MTYGLDRYVEVTSEECGCRTAFDTLVWHGVGWVRPDCPPHAALLGTHRNYRPATDPDAPTGQMALL